MRFSHMFIERPIFATVCSLLITLIGYIAQQSLPIAEYPEIAPPTVNISASYPGATAQVIADTVATPIEQEVNGVDNMLYVTSQSTGDGRLTISVTFKPGTNIDQAQVLLQNRVAIAQPRLPDDVRRIGVTVRKASPDLMMVVHMISPDGSRDQQYISNYATLYVKDVLARTDGVGDVNIFGARDYSMRIWLDPALMMGRNLTAGDVVSALQAANLQVAAGSINQPPATSPGAFTLQVQTLGRLTSVEEFNNIVIRAEPSGAVVRVRDIARVELGAQDYTVNAYLDNKTATAIVIFQRPGLERTRHLGCREVDHGRTAKDFPPGVAYTIVYNPTEFIQTSVNAVVHTLFEAVVLVVLVVILFLQTWRAAIIPIVAIPVSLIGTFAVMAALGFTFNTLSLFGLVLAIGIVVDDAIVVVENVERYLRAGVSPREAAHKTMDEVGGALLAIALVLIAVFLPTAFITGLQGQFYRQFAITIAASTAISAFVSLTLSPALAALLLKPHSVHPNRSGLLFRLETPLRVFFTAFNRGFDRLASSYGAFTARLIRLGILVALAYGGLLFLTYNRLAATPTGLIPQLDRAYFIAAFQLPPGATLERSDAVVRAASELIIKRPGVLHSVAFTGFDGATRVNAPNTGVIFVALKGFEERLKEGLSKQDILTDLRQQLSGLRDAYALVLEPPSVPGIGTGGGLKLYVQDRAGRGSLALEGAAWSLAGGLNKVSGFQQVFTLFNNKTPGTYADIDRTKAEQLGVPISRVFEALSVYMGLPTSTTSISSAAPTGSPPKQTTPTDCPCATSRHCARATQKATWCRSARSQHSATSPSLIACRATIYTRPQRCKWRWRPAFRAAKASRPRRTSPPRCCRRVSASSGPRSLYRRNSLGHGGHGIWARRCVRIPIAVRSLRELAVAARRHPNRPDVYSRGHDRRKHPRVRPKHSSGDRPRRAGRPRRQECHSDRRVRQAGRRAG